MLYFRLFEFKDVKFVLSCIKLLKESLIFIVSCIYVILKKKIKIFKVECYCINVEIFVLFLN